ncbi:sensor histidine kinase [Terrisporobacter glycolicus]|uniref:sensor histidine kinase n=1 Tax=Terrisporobacter glycolicus TaxID=36841 RepID=UPI0034640C40
MKIDFNKANTILKIITTLMTICLNIWIYIIGVNFKVSIILVIFSVFIISGMFLYEKIYKNYMEEIFVQLSDMLATIIDMRDEEVFSIMEDTLFSKLQYQTIKLTNILKEKNRQIENDRNEIKSLISDIAHQLKTPITNLKIYGEILQDESLSKEERKEFNKIIILSLNRLSFLIESMIKMSRLESGVIQLKSQMNDLNDTVLLAINQVKKRAKVKNIDIKLEEIAKVKITYDKNWTAEAFFNILENAVKYTNKNGVIKVTIQNYEMFVRIDIQDNGVGIEEDELPKIFTRFYRGKNIGDIEGIGIGLYLTREIISKQGGYIKVKSNNKGSIFSLFLPNK